ncbi:MAG TPA: hypothetical protein VHD32_03555 [Candidatus Didemnitutus sp.]|nr:hypothetical protein [Candidatus Didemnitutus sp.]
METRVLLNHRTPPLVPTGVWFSITICASDRGTDRLCSGGRGQTLIDSAISYHHWQQWVLYLFLVMPDHVHAILGFPLAANPATTIGNWKRLTARMNGIDWQKNFFDHRIRPGESITNKADYIRQNPVRAGLVERPDEWTYVVDHRVWADPSVAVPKTRGSMRTSIPAETPMPDRWGATSPPSGLITDRLVKRASVSRPAWGHC